MGKFTKVYFFGCIGQPGHYLWNVNGRWPENNVVPWQQIDAKLTPQDPKDVSWEEKQPQGKTAIHQKAGWTAMAWWDRSGPDERYGCNSVLFAEGEHNFEQMKILLKEHWPEVHKRQSAELYCGNLGEVER